MYTLSDYYKFSKDIYESRGFSGIYTDGKSYLYESLLRQFGTIMGNESEYVLDKEWDVLIILDACRVDLLEEVAEEYDFIETPPHNTIWSADSYSEGWLKNNFTGLKAQEHSEKMNNLVHISGNPFTNDIFDGDEFQLLDEVWKYGWDNDSGYLPPDIMTDRAISNYRDKKPDQMIVHYMQPHAPFISDKNLGYYIDIDNFAHMQHTIHQQTPWELLSQGKVSRDELWTAYKDTLHVALDSVEKLLDNIDAERVIISADHGNAVGEWGIYGHPRKLQIPVLRNVPWVSTSAENKNNYTPKEYDIDNRTNLDRDSQLEALGYK